MTDLVSIARAVDYVEECLRQPITVADMAGSASYSVYHQASYVGLQYYPERWKVVGVLYVAGIETCDPSSLGAGTIVKTVPARGNASFVHLGSGDELGLTLDYVYHSWWPRSGTGRDRQGRP